MKIQKNKMSYRLNGLALSILIFLPIKAYGSEQSHATFIVENVGTIEQSGGKITGTLPATNELANGNLIFLGILFLLLSFFFMRFKKGTLYGK